MHAFVYLQFWHHAIVQYIADVQLVGPLQHLLGEGASGGAQK